MIDPIFLAATQEQSPKLHRFLFLQIGDELQWTLCWSVPPAQDFGQSGKCVKVINLAYFGLVYSPLLRDLSQHSARHAWAAFDRHVEQSGGPMENFLSVLNFNKDLPLTLPVVSSSYSKESWYCSSEHPADLRPSTFNLHRTSVRAHLDQKQSCSILTPTLLCCSC